MRNESAAGRRATVARNRQALRQLKRRKTLSIAMFVFACLITVIGIQALGYYLHFVPRVEAVNQKMAVFMDERTKMTVQSQVQEQFRKIIEALKPEEPHARQVLEQFELLVKFFRQTPVQIAEEVHDAILTLGEQFKADGEKDAKPLLTTASTDLQNLAATLQILGEIYTIEFDRLQADLDSPPWYMWPTSSLIRYRTGYLPAVTFNRAMYLSQIGETGTARVLLTGLYASAEDDVMKGLVYYGLGRLQWELFINQNEPENYFQSLKYIRQSIQSDPQVDLPKQVLDFMMSLDQGDSAPRAGEGDPTNPSEGESASVSEGTPLF